MARLSAGIALIAVVALTACGGDDDSLGVASIDDVADTTPPAVAGEDPSAGGDEAAVIQFAECMRRGGIDFPDPIVDAEGDVGFDLLALRDLADVDQDDLEAAFEDCFEYLEGVSFGFEQVFEAEFQDAVLEFSVCMRANGFDMPDPDFSALLSGGPLYPVEPDIDDPDFEAAFDECQDTLPGIPGIAGG